ncbi:uncharacterized protein [Lepeophtheirus salmonis]|uniref:uncharacterized protein isoform X1 n=1 Tax=Lepeophtheirus salmonis TaxID=72036 RepID=UPI001AE5BF69|nr:serine/threonine protein phosphatase 2A regulatory subunit B''alpha-like isoform X1 [Lepeophtheirus salmonis]XP_040580345.1 serine/threonine protein phosphatase 2A regulatory subunit B''alpha-like isoform X1 [Lepeophtheirus salmonis]XP_040580346.1 serine/threonine protein phosphatase 2A regulatory subunit B''alpha-like isoform X1 [Lepeophtheirus salmonis]XP_040580347.1 serine/threonine protein phosphatase 2A regulatory subunit B''alpha-like isoform X1 [Lepeophtheirus salmonis]XP_040580348.1 
MAESRKDTSDLYRQLLDSNDLVKELDDIEAISQQISQHAELLYQNWKTHNSRASSLEPQENRFRNHPHHNTLRHSSVSPISNINNEAHKFLTLPARSSSMTPQNTLELLASPDVSGNLKDLVSNFVSSDRAKQAARQTTVSQMNPIRRSPDVHRAMPTIFNHKKPMHETTTTAKTSKELEFIPIPVKHETSSSSDEQDIDSRIHRSGVSSAKYLFETPKSDMETTPLSVLRPRPLAASTRSLFHNRKSVPAPPHPELTPQQKQHIFERTNSAAQTPSVQSLPIHRFRNSGSVAERVLIFEKCPVFTNPSNLISDPKSRPSSFSGAPSKVIPITNLKNNEVYPSNLRNRHSIAVSPSFSESGENDKLRLKDSFGPRIIREIPIKKLDQPKPPETNFSSPLTENKPTTKFYSHSDPLPAATSPSTTTTSSNSSSSGQIRPLVSQCWSPPSKILLKPKVKPNKVTLRKKDSVEKSQKHKDIPRFFFPFGNPATRQETIDSIIDKFGKEFQKFGGSVSIEELGAIFKSCGVSYFWKGIVFNAVKDENSKTLSFTKFSDYWKKIISTNYDEASQFIRIVTKSSIRKDILPDDLVPLIQDVVDTHPGLGFLKDATDFHSRYVHTVIARIFFSVNRSWSGKITVSELRKSNFLSTLMLLSDEEDINRITNYFSYEHFYVIYCKFWELDTDHDLFIDREDLSQHNDQAISSRMIDRIFSGTVTRGTAQKEGKMSYTEFVWFLLAEEDKRSPTSIEYWFRCMDLDGDGYLSMYELEFFYEEQLTRMEQLGIETLPFEDCLCQMLDMIMPQEGNRISLTDLKACRMTPIFFDTFFNLEKYLDHEQRDPFASQRELDEDGNEISDWDRFAADEYELLVAEEGNNENMERLEMNYDELDPEMHLGENYEKTEIEKS